MGQIANQMLLKLLQKTADRFGTKSKNKEIQKQDKLPKQKKSASAKNSKSKSFP